MTNAPAGEHPARPTPKSDWEMQYYQLENLRLISENIHYMRRELEATRKKVASLNTIVGISFILWLLGGLAAFFVFILM